MVFARLQRQEVSSFKVDWPVDMDVRVSVENGTKWLRYGMTAGMPGGAWLLVRGRDDVAS